MAKHLQVKIVTPERVIVSDKYISASIPSITGELTVLAEHIPIVTPIKSGEIILREDSGYNNSFSVSSGILEVRPDSSIVILANRAEHAKDIDVERAKAAKKRIETLMQEKKNQEDVDYARLQSILEKETARIKVAEKHRRSKKAFSTK